MIFLLLLVIIEVVLFLTNYTNNTYLLGWDNIMPEFNLWLNFKRSLFSIWQNYRGLGLLDGMAHSANLFHTIYIFLLSLIFPQNILRYLFIFLTHLIGGIGFYLLANNLIKNKKVSFIGALFYMFNLGIIQMYFAPLEVFAVHFCALPFLALLLTKLLEKPNKKNFLMLFIFSLLTSPQAFVPTVFGVFFIFFILALFSNYLLSKNLKLLVIIFLIIIFSNSFWLIPYFYQTAYNSKIIPNTRINQFASDELYYRNRAFGNLTDVLFLKGFMINTFEYDSKNHKNIYFLQPWRNHIVKKTYIINYLIILAISLYGLYKIIRKRKKQYLSYLGSFFIALFFLANNSILFRQTHEIIRNFFPLMGEVLRIPFTKFITLFTFCLTIFLTYGLNALWIKIKRYQYPMLIIFVLIIGYLALPAFQGNFISPLLKVSLPKEYISLMNYLNNNVNEEKRIAFLPVYTFWNWEYRRWGHAGSGFLWYGIKQPITLRAFDPWSNFNEQFYNELAYAFSSQNTTLLKNVIQKYNLSYFLLDKNIVNTLSTKPINYEKIEQFLLNSQLVNVEKKFRSLILYKTNYQSDRIYITTKNLPQVETDFHYSLKDQIYEDLGHYISSSNKAKFYYPFYNLYSSKLQNDLNFKAVNNINSITLKLLKNPKIKTDLIELPSLFQFESLIPVNIKIINGQLIINPIYPKIFINNKLLTTTEKPIILKPVIIHNPNQIFLLDSNTNIKPGENAYIINNYFNTIMLVNGQNKEYITFDTRIIKRNSIKIPFNDQKIYDIEVNLPKIKSPFTNEDLISKKNYQIINPDIETNPARDINSYRKVNENQNKITIETRNSAVRLVMWKENLYHNASYIIFAKTNYFSGLPINFYLDNPFQKRSELETRLSKNSKENVLIIPKSESYYQGYGLHFIVKSLGNEIAKSEINNLSIFPFPYETLSRIRFINTKIGNNVKTKYIVLNEAYHPGWLAFINGKKLKNHLLVNNWANGWIIPEEINPSVNDITIIFWPQYLQFLGFGLLIITFVLILRFSS